MHYDTKDYYSIFICSHRMQGNLQKPSREHFVLSEGNELRGRGTREPAAVILYLCIRVTSIADLNCVDIMCVPPVSLQNSLHTVSQFINYCPELLRTIKQADTHTEDWW